MGAGDMTDKLPPGFVIERGGGKKAPPASSPALPPGFQVEQMQAQQPSEPERIYNKGFLPLSKDPQTGETSFDLRGGIIGSILDAWGSGAQTMKDVAEGRTDPTSEEAISGALPGALLMTPMGAATRAATAAVPGTLKSLRVGAPKVPTTQELKAAGGAGFDAARQMGVDYSADAVKSMADDLIGQLARDGFRDGTADKTLGVLRQLQVPPAASVAEGERVLFTLDDLIAARRTLQEIAGAGGSEGEAARRAVSALDDFVVGADPSSVVAGPAAAAAKTVADARANYAASFRSKGVEKAVTKAEQDAAAANSGANLGNRVRQRLKSLLQSDSATRGYSKEELEFLGEVVSGKFGANLARWASNFLGGGGGMAQYLVGGGAALGGGLLGGPYAAAAAATAVPLLGVGLRAASNKLTERHAQSLAELLRMRSPLYEQATKNPPTVAGLNPEIGSILTRALMMQQAAQGGQ
jgi:hypothetical protein